MKKQSSFSEAIISIVLLVFILAGVAGCIPAQSNNGALQETGKEKENEIVVESKAGDYPKTIVDSAGQTVTIEKPLERIVITQSQPYESLRSLGLFSDIIVGAARDVPPYDLNFFPELASIPSVGDRWAPDVEAILGLQPDVVFLFPASDGGGKSGNELDDAADVFNKAGITVLRFALNDINTYDEEFRKLGHIFNRTKEAEEHLKWREDVLKLVTDRVADLTDKEKPKVLFTANVIEGVHYIYGKLNFIEETGGIDIFGDQPGKYMAIDTEEILRRDPDIIVRTAPAGKGGINARDVQDLKQARDEIMNSPELQNVTAVKNGDVYIITDQIAGFFQFSGNRQFMQTVYQAKWFHPELFADVEPKTIFQEYLTKYQGLDADLEKQGAFVYHPEKNPKGH